MTAQPDLAALLALYRGANPDAFAIAGEGAEMTGQGMATVWKLGEQVAEAAGDEAGQAQLDAARAAFALALAQMRALALAACAQMPGPGKG
jgi:hypothetical protein